MRSFARMLSVMSVLVLPACGDDGGTSQDAAADRPGDGTAHDGADDATTHALVGGLQYSGALLLVRPVAFATSGASATAAEMLTAVTRWERIEVSAPILPRTAVLYAHEGTSYPGTLGEEIQVAHDAALTYDFLLSSCAATYDIVLQPSADGPLDDAVLGSNYEQVARCAYERHTAKPYWIPALVDHVDVCGTELGTGWRLIDEDDLLALNDGERRFLVDGLATPHAAGFFGNFYFGLSVWVRGNDGQLKLGGIGPGSTGLISGPTETTSHYEGGYALRCIRRSITDL